jgi:hypothetical protein
MNHCIMVEQQGVMNFEASPARGRWIVVSWLGSFFPNGIPGVGRSVGVINVYRGIKWGSDGGVAKKCDIAIAGQKGEYGWRNHDMA